MAPRTLVADSSADVRELVEGIMTMAGHEVVSVTDGETAFGLLSSQRFDLVIVDVSVPGLSGIDLVERCRRDLDEDLRVVLISGLSGLGDIRRGLEAGADRYVTKPFEASTLVREVDAALASPA